MKDLKDKIVLSTGGGSGVGKIMTRLMLERKAKVILVQLMKFSRHIFPVKQILIPSPVKVQS